MSAAASSSSNPAFRRVMRYLWDPERKNTDHEHDIVVLGRRYNPKVLPDNQQDLIDKATSSSSTTENTATDGYSTNWPVEFLDDIRSRIWMTYRTNFKLIPRAKNGPSGLSLGGFLRGSGIDPNGFTSDIGWGCMIRTGQSLLANALVLLQLGRDWRQNDNEYKELDIVQKFTDDPESPFSLHQFVEHGETYCGKNPGEWFGPSAAASSIKGLCDKTGLLNVYVGDGSDVYENLLMKKLEDNNPTLILLPIRLGIDNVNPVYWDALKNLLAFPQAIGIAGGRPSSSHYFFGFQNNDLFYLDPHLHQPCLKKEELPESLNTVHCTKIRMLHMDEMDPSMLVGFLIRDEEDYKDWKQRINENNNPRPIINIAAKEPSIACGSTISVGSDNDETEFIDVGFDDDDDSDESISSSRDDLNDLSTSELQEGPDNLEGSGDPEYSEDSANSGNPGNPENDDSVSEMISKEELPGASTEYDTVLIDTSQMLSGSNNSSYVEPSCIDCAGNTSIDKTDDDWEVMRGSTSEK